MKQDNMTKYDEKWKKFYDPNKNNNKANTRTLRINARGQKFKNLLVWDLSPKRIVD